MGRSELCAWLRANSSGDYRPAADAATEIEMLAEAKDNHFAQAMANGAAAREYREEAEALRKDAERWRWWRAQVWGFRALGSARPAVFAYPSAMELPPVRGDIMRGSVAEHFDHAVDAAMAERKAVGVA